MKYILIFLVITDAEFGAYSLTAEFDDKPACMEVLEKLRLTRQGTFEHLEPHSANIVEGCYPKGSAK
jgi:hypothetical protein